MDPLKYILSKYKVGLYQLQMAVKMGNWGYFTLISGLFWTPTYSWQGPSLKKNFVFLCQTLPFFGVSTHIFFQKDVHALKIDGF